MMLGYIVWAVPMLGIGLVMGGWLYHILQQRKKARAHAVARQLTHDLRTPLNAILGFSEMMHRQVVGPMPTVYADYAADIHRSALVLLRLSETITDSQPQHRKGLQ